MDLGSGEDPTSNLIDLAGHDIGGSLLYASTEFFGEAANLLKPGRGRFDPSTYSLNGKIMDGWETARHSVLDESRAGHDFCIIRLGAAGMIDVVDIDTLWFTGNYPESATLEATTAPIESAWADLHLNADWVPVVPRTALLPGTDDKGHNLCRSLDAHRRFTHVRLTIYPDGGVSRLRVFGRPSPNFHHLRSLGIAVDLACVVNGARVVAASNMFYSHPAHLLLPERASSMADGWETSRSRQPDHQDWVVVRLGAPGVVVAVEVDTSHFRGNFPHRFAIETALATDSHDVDALSWVPCIAPTPGKPHARLLLVPAQGQQPVSHVKLITMPDGGVSRLRVFCKDF